MYINSVERLTEISAAVDTGTCWAWCLFGQWSYKEVHLKQLGSHGNCLYKVITWAVRHQAGLSFPVQKITWRRCCISHFWGFPQGTTSNILACLSLWQEQLLEIVIQFCLFRFSSFYHWCTIGFQNPPLYFYHSALPCILIIFCYLMNLQLLVPLVSSFRYEGPEVNTMLAKSEAKILHDKISEKAYSDEEVIRILTTRSKAQLAATLNHYNDHFGNAINKVLTSICSI